MLSIGLEIKERIRKEIGDWITVSIGIAPNRYLAKVASNLKKPDGLEALTRENIETVFMRLALEDLCGIKTGNATRLRTAGIYSPQTMLMASAKTLERAFHSIVGYHWWLRLHGWEDGAMYKSFDAPDVEQKSFGQSHALGTPRTPKDPRLWQILSQLTMKMGRRVRECGFTARGVGISTLFTPIKSGFEDHGYWHAQNLDTSASFADSDLYRRSHTLLQGAPDRPVRILAVYCYRLTHDLYSQQTFLQDDIRKERLTRAIDRIADRFGDFTVTPARMAHMEQKVLDRIAFGRAGFKQ